MATWTIAAGSAGRYAARAMRRRRHRGDGRRRDDRRAVHGDDRRAGRVRFGAPPVGSYNITVVSAGLTAFRRAGVEVAADQTAPLDITLNAATAAQAAELERQELLQHIATLEAAHHRPGIEHRAVGARDARPPRRGVRRSDGDEHDEPVPGVEAGRHLPARARLPPADDQREDRGSARRRRGAQRRGRRRRGHRHAVRQADQGRAIRWSTTAPTRWRRPTCSSRPASRSTPCSSPTSSG